MSDTLRPKGSVELECCKCHWCSWFDPLCSEVLQAAKGIPYTCSSCKGEPEPLSYLKAD